MDVFVNDVVPEEMAARLRDVTTSQPSNPS